MSQEPSLVWQLKKIQLKVGLKALQVNQSYFSATSIDFYITGLLIPYDQRGSASGISSQNFEATDAILVFQVQCGFGRNHRSILFILFI